jgi:gliding motility-associated-like protein
MHSLKKIFFVLAVSFLSGNSNLYAQTSSPDCSTAPNACGNTNVTFVSSSGSGSFVDFTTSSNVSNPTTSPAAMIPPGGSGCMFAGELNPHFLIITCQSPGTLEFAIASGPGVQVGCYDWIMWPYTATTCAGISGNTLPPVRCCWNSSCSGGTGIASTANMPSGSTASQYCAPLNVNCGDKFLLCISNYSGVNANVPINFIGTSIISCAPTTGTPLAVNNATICSGGTATLIVTGGTGTATWTPGPSVTNTLIVSPPATTTYTATKPGGCGTGTIAATVSVVPTPVAVANNNSPVCAGATFTLFGSGVGTYSWSGPGGFTSTLQNPVLTNATTAMSGVYTLTVSNGNCKSTATTSVTVNPNPVPTAANTGPYCPGQTIQLSVGVASSYTWTGPSAFSSNNQNPTLGPATTAMSGIYTVSITNVQGCKGTATTNVVVNPSPVVNVGSNSPLCAGSALNLTSTGGGTYSWAGPNAFTSSLQNPTIGSVTSANTGVYSVTVTNLGCTSTGSVNVTVTTPTSSAANTGPYCAGQTIILTTPAATTYTWSGPGGFTSNNQNPNIVGSTTAMSGIYTVSATTGGCTSSATTNVVVNALPVPVAGNTGPYCPGNTIQLNVTAASSYTWSGPSAFSSNLQNPTQGSATTAMGGVYTVSVTNAQGCIGSITTNVVVNPSPIVNVASNSPLCAGTTLNLTSTGGGTYSWAGPNAFSSALQNPTIGSVTSANTGVYSVTVTNLGCTATGSVNVTVTTPTSTASNTGPYCAGQTIALTTPAATTYTWTGPGGFTSNNQNPNIVGSTTAMSGIYTVSVTTGGCSSTATTNVVVNALPIPVAGNTGPYCPGNTIQLNVTAASSYTWSGPSAFSSNLQNPTRGPATTVMGGMYTVSVTNAQGCIGSITTNVVVNPTPVVNVGSNSPVCINTSINLTSTGGGTYNWAGPNAFISTNQNPTITNATSVNSGVYSVTVTNLGCTATGSVNVTVTTPTTSASNTGPYCAGTTMSLSAPAATSYTWSGPLGYSSNSQNAIQPGSTPAMSGTYTVIVSIGTCTASATTNVVINALPTPTAQSNSPVCTGQTINLTGLGGTTYTWTGPSFNSNSATPNIPSATTSNSGNYVLTVTDANGCTNTANVNVVVNSLPVIAVNTPTSCVNTPINLTSNGGVTYSWSGPNTFTSNVQNPNIPSAQLNMSGVYVVTVTNANNCVNTASANVSVLPLPTPNIAGNSPVCAGGTLSLQGSGGANYAWSGPGYTGISQNPTINNVTTAASGVYTLLVSSGSCTASTTYTVVINPLPVFNFSNSNVICNSQSNGTSTVNVTVGTGPYNYQWSNGQNTQVATGLSAGNYSCIVTDANNCSSLASTQINQPTAFTVTINSATNSACANTAINVNANGSGGTTPYTFTWTSGPTTSAYSINESAAGNYIYTVNATDANGCVSSNNINLTFFPQPTVTATSATVCAGTATTITASGATNYIWQPGNVSGPSYPFNGNTSVNVTVIGTSNGCSNSANASVVVSTIPSANFTTSGDKACVPACITLSGSGSANIISYGWTLNGIGIGNGTANETYCFSEAASYSIGLTVIDNNGCTQTAPPMTIELYPQPVADFNHAPIKPIVNIDQEVTFTDASWGTPIVSWNWYFMNTAQYTSVLQNPTFSYTEPGTYAVALVVKSDKGCLDTLIRAVEVGEDFGIYVPNAFTPNGDGMNDIFQPKGFGITKYELYIYDRWGELMFQTNTFEEGWNGARQKKKDVSYPLIIEDGVYTWLINCTSVFGKSHELKGHVTLIK